jgi:hypothetical protein
VARLRTLKPGFFTNEVLGALPPLCRILYEGLWVWADREGRLEDRPKYLKAVILPYDDCDVDAMLGALEHAGFITRYEAEGARFIAIPTFLDHQKPHPREAPSRIPPPLVSARLPPPPANAPAAPSSSHKAAQALPEHNLGAASPPPGPDPGTTQALTSPVVFCLGDIGLGGFGLGDFGGNGSAAALTPPESPPAHKQDSGPPVSGERRAPTRPNLPDLVPHVQALFRELKGGEYGLTPLGELTHREGEALRRLLRRAKGDVPEVMRRVGNAWGRTAYPTSATLAEVDTDRVWNASAVPQTATSPPRAPKRVLTHVRAEEQHYGETVGVDHDF